MEGDFQRKFTEDKDFFEFVDNQPKIEIAKPQSKKKNKNRDLDVDKKDNLDFLRCAEEEEAKKQAQMQEIE